MPYIFVQTFEEFAKAHGGEKLAMVVRNGDHSFYGTQENFVLRGKSWLFSDGAVAEQHVRQSEDQGYIFKEPPTDRAGKLHALHRYWSVAAERAETAFNELKSAVLNHAHYEWDSKNLFCDAPTERDDYGRPDAFASLKLVKEIVTDRRAKLAKLEQDIYNLPENVAGRAKEAEEQAEEQEEFAYYAERDAEIQEIEIDS